MKCDGRIFCILFLIPLCTAMFSLSLTLHYITYV